ncbi:MAG: hypothetical protein ABS43_25130 [Bordetella sp. SCN 67-23]|nr:tripartite tricarboxylate transporter substrate binding protein [Burkholderiales bacterium]ODS69708.1 MAG: hypothetical protein ABS43_25130 [Bordetella sp. SCN 67-23]OJW86078.1 MAG: hypothetical protein BGO71_12260 [Burkholderiales bacterium 67-32]
MNLIFKMAMGACSALAALAAVAQPAPNDAYATQPVKLVVTGPPGSVPDLLGRTIAQSLEEVRGGTAVIVESRPGANGVVGASQVVRAPADGTTLLLASDSLLTMLPYVNDKLPFRPQADLKPIAQAVDAAVVLVVPPQLGVRTLKDFVAKAKAAPDGLTYASQGPASVHNRSMLRLQQMAGIRLLHVPYGNKSPLVDLAGGQVNAMWSGISGAYPLIRQGKLIPLAVSTSTRASILPEVPTTAELGYPGFDLKNWFGFVAPAAMSPAVARRIESDLLKAIDKPAVRERISELGMEVRVGTADAMAKLIRAESESNKALVASGVIPKE